MEDKKENNMQYSKQFRLEDGTSGCNGHLHIPEVIPYIRSITVQNDCFLITRISTEALLPK